MRNKHPGLFGIKTGFSRVINSARGNDRNHFPREYYSLLRFYSGLLCSWGLFFGYIISVSSFYYCCTASMRALCFVLLLFHLLLCVRCSWELKLLGYGTESSMRLL